MRTLIGWIREGFTGAHHEIVYQGVIGADTVVTQWRMTGRHTGPLLGVEATGRAGVEMVHPLTGEPWVVRRLLVRDPDEHVINVLGQQ